MPPPLLSLPCCVALAWAMNPPGIVDNKSCPGKFPDDFYFCLGASCNHNKSHKGWSSHNIGSGGEMSEGAATNSIGPGEDLRHS